MSYLGVCNLQDYTVLVSAEVQSRLLQIVIQDGYQELQLVGSWAFACSVCMPRFVTCWNPISVVVMRLLQGIAGVNLVACMSFVHLHSFYAQMGQTAICKDDVAQTMCRHTCRRCLHFFLPSVN